MSRRFPLVAVGTCVVLVVIALAVISTRDSSSSASSRNTSSGVAIDEAETPGSTTTMLPTESSAADPAEQPYTTPGMPVSVSLSKTSGLRSGDVVSALATPANGSQAFGVEARLCRGDAAIAFDAQMFPTRAGLCIPKPFADGTDSVVEVVNKPPYGPVPVQFRVGTGSQTFALQDGSQVTITCDAANPCQLVLKIQYPNGFGFQGVPLTFG